VKEMKNSSIREHQYVQEMKAEEGRLRSEMAGVLLYCICVG
jgi:hypothetical protein